MRPIWIIDDDRSIRWVFEKALTREDIPFKTFSSAQEALAALTGAPPQVVVSDILVQGSRHVANEHILNQMRTKVGSEFVPEVLQDDVRVLDETPQVPGAAARAHEIPDDAHR